jgi:hypothetical protein
MLRRAAIAAILAVLAVPSAAGATPAVHTTEVTRSVVEQTLEDDVCFDEDVFLTLRVQLVTTVTETPSGGFSGVQTLNATYDMVGLETGRVYRGTEHSAQGGHADVVDGAPNIFFNIFTLLRASSGDTPNLLLQSRNMFVLSPNGELILFREDFSIRCVGSGDPVEQP